MNKAATNVNEMEEAQENMLALDEAEGVEDDASIDEQQQANFAEMDQRICGDLRKYKHTANSKVDKNRRLDELFAAQTLDN